MHEQISTVEPVNLLPGQSADAGQKPVDDKEIEDYFRSRIKSAERNRKKFYSEWKRNVELRIGHLATRFSGGIDIEDNLQTEINPDWSLTKTKTANLFSQVPEVQITHENKQYAKAIPPFARALNYELGEKRAHVAVCMEEVLNDVVNASGIGAVIVGYAARFEQVPMPATDQMTGQPQAPPVGPPQAPGALPTPPMAGMMAGMPAPPSPPMVMVDRVVSDKFFAHRISPVDLLWPAEFVGSCFDDADWIGHCGRMSWSEAKNEFDLPADMEDKVTRGSDVQFQDDLRSEPEKGGLSEIKAVKYKELFYWRHRVDPEEKSFKAIWRIVYVEGMDRPAKHEPWEGQKYEDGDRRKYVGSCKFPIRVLTLTYITDNPVPPSDSAAGRPQVNDMRRSRSQMFQNRERSIPIRWFDVNRIDPLIQDTLMRGTWQGMIPSNGDGARAIGEIARASYPTEDLTFDQQVKADLMESWQIGPNQAGVSPPGRRTSAEVSTTQQNFATRIGQERAKVASFFLGISEVMAGWMVLYSEFPSLSDQERQEMRQVWDYKSILHDLVLKIRPDASVVLDIQARIERLMNFINMTAKSGFVNVAPIIAEIAELSGLDPNEVIVKPEPKVYEPNISFRFTGKDDLINPVVMAMLVHTKQAPSPEDMEAGKKILQAMQTPPTPDQPPGGPGGPGPEGAPEAPPPLPPAEGAHPDWNMASKIAKRSRDMQSGG